MCTSFSKAGRHVCVGLFCTLRARWRTSRPPHRRRRWRAVLCRPHGRLPSFGRRHPGVIEHQQDLCRHVQRPIRAAAARRLISLGQGVQGVGGPFQNLLIGVATVNTHTGAFATNVRRAYSFNTTGGARSRTRGLSKRREGSRLVGNGRSGGRGHNRSGCGSRRSGSFK